MAQTNVKSRAATKRTHEGAPVARMSPMNHLRHMINAHMLWEDNFYIDGKSAAKMLDSAVEAACKIDADETAAIILAGRNEMNIRHASLKASVTYAKIVKGEKSRNLISAVIQRADELAEVIAMAGGKKMPHAVRKGVADAFQKFDEYQFGKYKGVGKAFTLRDAVFMSHPNPETQPLVQKIVDDTLEIPNTWETRLSSGEDKKAVFTDLLSENKLGAMALLRNLRNMEQAGVDKELVKAALASANWSRVLPFRFLSAVENSASFTKDVDAAFQKAVSGSVYLRGKTAVIVDSSGSMSTPVSARSSVTAVQTGAVLGAAVNGDDVFLGQFGSTAKSLPNFGSLASAMMIRCGAVGHGTDVDAAINLANSIKPDRIILITDGQFMPSKAKVDCPVYIINVKPYGNNGVINGPVTQISGFSPQVLRYIAAQEGRG